MSHSFETDILHRFIEPLALGPATLNMRFSFVDRVLELRPGVKITTVKSLSLAEEYLADHFPRFPVMPGVLMLEAMTQAGAMLVAASEDFAHSMITLKEARNIRFADFVRPGDVLTVEAEIVKQDDREVQLKTQGTLPSGVAVSGRLVLERYNLADTRPEMETTDRFLRRHLKDQLALVYQPSKESTTGGSPLLAPLSSTTEPTRGPEASQGKV